MDKFMIACRVCGEASFASLWLDSLGESLAINEYVCPVCKAKIKVTFGEVNRFERDRSHISQEKSPIR